MTSTDLIIERQTWAKFRFLHLGAAGRVYPRLLFTLETRASLPQRKLRVIQLNGSLSFQSEILGIGWLEPYGPSGTEIDLHDRQVTLTIPVAHLAIQFVQERARGHAIPVELQLWGTAFVRDDTPVQQQDPHSPFSSGQWHFAPFQDSKLSVNIPRSDWVKNVLEPIGFGEYVLMEMPVPKIPERERWETALEHLKRAEEQYGMGNDPGVFQYCRAMVESLEGYPKRIVAGMEDDKKREQIDALLHEAGQYFHAGRHVSKAGPMEGEFPVDHRDAEFALGLAKLSLTYMAKLLAQS